LLDGKGAATHWGMAERLAARYPAVRVERDMLYVDEGGMLTSAGVAAGLDCCLYLLRQLAAPKWPTGWRAACWWHRTTGRAGAIHRAPAARVRQRGRFAEVLACVTANLGMAHSIDALAERAAMSRRNFTRHFRQATGTSFKQWLLNQRLAHAQGLLEKARPRSTSWRRKRASARPCPCASISAPACRRRRRRIASCSAKSWLCRIKRGPMTLALPGPGCPGAAWR
jgi:transcriptional regulator GlxA family with amidase domain